MIYAVEGDKVFTLAAVTEATLVSNSNPCGEPDAQKRPPVSRLMIFHRHRLQCVRSLIDMHYRLSLPW